MWKMKGCPRCKGDVFIDRRDNIWFEQCLQCGYKREMQNVKVHHLTDKISDVDGKKIVDADRTSV